MQAVSSKTGRSWSAAKQLDSAGKGKNAVSGQLAYGRTALAGALLISMVFRNVVGAHVNELHEHEGHPPGGANGPLRCPTDPAGGRERRRGGSSASQH